MKAHRTFLDIAAWVNGHEDDTTICFPARGYGLNDETLPDGSSKAVVVGHTLVSMYENPEFEPVGIPEEFKHIKAPGIYWMEGGTQELVTDEECIKIGDDAGLDCPYPVTTKAEGTYYDICYEMLAKGMGIDVPTHCDCIESQNECAKVNTCKWIDGDCVYSAELWVWMTAKCSLPWSLQVYYEMNQLWNNMIWDCFV